MYNHIIKYLLKNLNYWVEINNLNEIEFYNVEVTKWKDNGGIAL